MAEVLAEDRHNRTAIEPSQKAEREDPENSTIEKSSTSTRKALDDVRHQNSDGVLEPKKEESPGSGSKKDVDNYGQSTGSEEESPINTRISVMPETSGPAVGKTRDFVHLSRQELAFTRKVLFPGGGDAIMLKVTLENPLSEQSGELPKLSVKMFDTSKFGVDAQPIFTFKQADEQEFHLNGTFSLSEGDELELRLAVEAPTIKETVVLKGGIILQLANLDPIVLPLEMTCEFPRISNAKELYSESSGMNVLKVPVPKNTKISPLQFKNQSANSISFEVELASLSTEPSVEEAYNLTVQRNVNTLANSPFTIQLNLTTNEDFEGELPAKQIIRRILILKIKNSAVHFYYPLQAIVFQSNNTNNITYN